MLSSRKSRGGLQACYSWFSLAKSAQKGRGSNVSLRRVGFRHQPERAKIQLGRGVAIIAPAPLSCGTLGNWNAPTAEGVRCAPLGGA